MKTGNNQTLNFMKEFIADDAHTLNEEALVGEDFIE
jgi:hypothetical protein